MSGPAAAPGSPVPCRRHGRVARRSRMGPITGPACATGNHVPPPGHGAGASQPSAEPGSASAEAASSVGLSADDAAGEVRAEQQFPGARGRIIPAGSTQAHPRQIGRTGRGGRCAPARRTRAARRPKRSRPRPNQTDWTPGSRLCPEWVPPRSGCRPARPSPGPVPAVLVMTGWTSGWVSPCPMPGVPPTIGWTSGWAIPCPMPADPLTIGRMSGGGAYAQCPQARRRPAGQRFGRMPLGPVRRPPVHRRRERARIGGRVEPKRRRRSCAGSRGPSRGPRARRRSAR